VEHGGWVVIGLIYSLTEGRGVPVLRGGQFRRIGERKAQTCDMGMFLTPFDTKTSLPWLANPTAGSNRATFGRESGWASRTRW
jgi:hypothetical protein